MADRSQALLLFFLLYASLAHCRIVPQPTATGSTAVLDVSASLDATAHAISYDAEQQNAFGQDKKKATFSPSAATLSLELHARDFLPTPSAARHTDYKALTLSRLSRDAARVRGVMARVALAVEGTKKADLLPVSAEAETEAYSTGGGGAVEGPVVSGTSQGSGEYFSRVGIGRPPKPLYVVLDTGSDVTWVQCQPCADCYQQSDPVFDPSASATYSPMSCDAKPCRALDISACRNSSCLYQVSYGDGSYTVGDFATETLTFGNSVPVSGVALGCGHDNEGLFVGAAGLLGLGGGELSFPSQLSAKSFSYCLVDRDSPSSSTLEFGGPLDAAAVAAPLLRNSKIDTFYYVGMTGISVGGEMLSIPPSAFAMDESGAGGVIVDSGTAVTRLQREAYAALRSAFANGTGGLPSAAGVALFDTCYDLSSRKSVEVPTVAFHFPAGKVLRLPAKNYLIPVDSAGTFCLAFAPTNAPLSIIGNVQQQGTRVAIDRDNALLAFTPNQC